MTKINLETVKVLDVPHIAKMSDASLLSENTFVAMLYEGIESTAKVKNRLSFLVEKKYLKKIAVAKASVTEGVTSSVIPGSKKFFSIPDLVKFFAPHLIDGEDNFTLEYYIVVKRVEGSANKSNRSLGIKENKDTFKRLFSLLDKIDPNDFETYLEYEEALILKTEEYVENENTDLTVEELLNNYADYLSEKM